MHSDTSYSSSIRNRLAQVPFAICIRASPVRDTPLGFTILGTIILRVKGWTHRRPTILTLRAPASSAEEERQRLLLVLLLRQKCLLSRCVVATAVATLYLLHSTQRYASIPPLRCRHQGPSTASAYTHRTLYDRLIICNTVYRSHW